MTDDRAKEVLKTVKERANGTPVMVAKLSRVSGATYLFVEVAQEVEDLFATGRVNESTEWSDGDEHHGFYRQEYTGELRSFMSSQYDAYGSDIIDSSGTINKAVFRTQGLADGQTFKLDGPYSETTLKQAVQQLRQFAEELHEKFLSTAVIVSEVKRLDIDSLQTTGGQ